MSINEYTPLLQYARLGLPKTVHAIQEAARTDTYIPYRTVEAIFFSTGAK